MAKLSGQFRNSTWDPLLIVSQIIAVQSIFYLALGLWLVLMNLLIGTSRSLDHIFKYQIIAVQRIFSMALGLWLVLMNLLTGNYRSLDHILKYQIFYLALGLWLVIMNLLIGTSHSLDHILKYQEIHVRDVPGKLVIASFVLNSLTGACGLWLLVERSKQCLDFSCTVHLIHLAACWLYNGSFPDTISWWLLNTACLAIMCICAEFLCVRTELTAIPLKMAPKVDL